MNTSRGRWRTLYSAGLGSSDIGWTEDMAAAAVNMRIKY